MNENSRSIFVMFDSLVGSTMFIAQAIGSLLSGMLAGWLGRKRAMMAVNLPYLVAWFMLFRAESVAEIFIGSILHGLCNGLAQSPTITYVGEIA